jgi:hypothetical protein
MLAIAAETSRLCARGQRRTDGPELHRWAHLADLANPDRRAVSRDELLVLVVDLSTWLSAGGTQTNRCDSPHRRKALGTDIAR